MQHNKDNTLIAVFTCILIFETTSSYVAQAGLEFPVLLTWFLMLSTTCLCQVKFKQRQQFCEDSFICTLLDFVLVCTLSSEPSPSSYSPTAGFLGALNSVPLCFHFMYVLLPTVSPCHLFLRSFPYLFQSSYQFRHSYITLDKYMSCSLEIIHPLIPPNSKIYFKIYVLHSSQLQNLFFIYFIKCYFDTVSFGDRVSLCRPDQFQTHRDLKCWD